MIEIVPRFIVLLVVKEFLNTCLYEVNIMPSRFGELHQS